MNILKLGFTTLSNPLINIIQQIVLSKLLSLIGMGTFLSNLRSKIEAQHGVYYMHA